MKLIIHDLTQEQAQKWLPSGKEVKKITDRGVIQSCIGCFGCWVKTPGACILKDHYEDMGEKMARADELIIVSECVYGGYSPFVKTVMDRSISYLHPYFVIKNGEMHHRRRYKKDLTMRVYFYGEGIGEAEKQLARSVVEANALNYYADVKVVEFAERLEDLEVSKDENGTD